MNYTLEKIDDSSVDYILKSVHESRALTRDFVSAKDWGGFPVGWVRDLASGSFLISIPNFMRDERGDRYYCFYYEGAAYKLRLIGFWGWDAQIVELEGDSPASSANFNEALKSAFAVHKEGVSIKDGRLLAIGESIIPMFKD